MSINLSQHYLKTSVRSFKIHLPIADLDVWARCWNLGQQKKIADSNSFGGNPDDENDKSELIKNITEVMEECLDEKSTKSVSVGDLAYPDWLWLLTFIKNESEEEENKLTYSFTNVDDNGEEVIDKVEFSYKLSDFVIDKKKGWNDKPIALGANKDIVFHMKIPNIYDLEECERLPTESSKLIGMIIKSIDKVCVGEDELRMHEEESAKNITELINELQQRDTNKLAKFFMNAPAAVLKKKITNPRTNEEVDIEVRDIKSFLGL